jgi:hypothetical protein
MVMIELLLLVKVNHGEVKISLLGKIVVQEMKILSDVEMTNVGQEMSQ